jgi:hypothetical protein
MLKDFPEAEQRQMASQLKRLGVKLEYVPAPAMAEPPL